MELLCPAVLLKLSQDNSYGSNFFLFSLGLPLLSPFLPSSGHQRIPMILFLLNFICYTALSSSPMVAITREFQWVFQILCITSLTPLSQVPCKLCSLVSIRLISSSHLGVFYLMYRTFSMSSMISDSALLSSLGVRVLDLHVV